MATRCMDKILQGMLKYTSQFKSQVVNEMKVLRSHPETLDPQALYITCMDSRLQPSFITQTHPGNMFVIRNAGNLVPHQDSSVGDSAELSSETAALDLCCRVAGIKNVIVCGHSDCRAMNALHKLLSESKQDPGKDGPLQKYLRSYASKTFAKYEQLLQDSKKPVQFEEPVGKEPFKVYIDPDDNFEHLDKLSQLNVLQQMENIGSLKFLEKVLTNDEVKLHAWWFHLDSGDFYVLDRKEECFVKLTESNAAELL